MSKLSKKISKDKNWNNPDWQRYLKHEYIHIEEANVNGKKEYIVFYTKDNERKQQSFNRKKEAIKFKNIAERFVE